MKNEEADENDYLNLKMLDKDHNHRDNQRFHKRLHWTNIQYK